jgi:hypothetical protein
LLAKGACRNRLAGFASKVREPARSYPAPVILQFSKLTGGKPVQEGVFAAQISYAVETSAFELPQLLNVIFGNTSH